MKFAIYIDYSASYKPMTCEYRTMTAKTLSDAIIEADTIHDPETMYLVRIMEKRGKVEKVDSDIKAETYSAVVEKRSTKWAVMEREHIAKRFFSKFGEWFETV